MMHFRPTRPMARPARLPQRPLRIRRVMARPRRPCPRRRLPWRTLLAPLGTPEGMLAAALLLTAILAIR